MTQFAALLAQVLAPSNARSGPTGIDLFASAGGLTIGLKAAGVRTVAAVEVNPYRVGTYLRHTPTTVLTSDIRQVDFVPYRGVDIVYGGPPCQPFSSGGLRRAAQDERNMIPEFLRAVEEISPSAVLMENAPGLISANRLAYSSKLREGDWSALGNRKSK
jgi:DNA (cytosine-5)-methyltransferase 1